MKPRQRTVRAALAALPLTASPLFATGHAAATAAAVDAATWTGTFHSSCAMPYGPEGPEDGPYSCGHAATSVGCAAVADTGSVTAYAKLCKADLSSGATSGGASVVSPPYSIWTCDSGVGTGTFRYQPSSADAAFLFPVSLEVAGSQVVVTGSYTQAGTGRTIAVRAHFPAVCAADTSGGDYAGSVTPV